MPSGTPPAFAHEALAVIFHVGGGRLWVLLRGRVGGRFDGASEGASEGARSLPGGPVAVDERLGSCVARCLASVLEVSRLAHLEQLETRSDPARDPRRRVLATAYLGLVRADSSTSLAGDATWYDVGELPEMALDHASIVSTALDRLRAKLSYTTIALALAPEHFTVARLSDVYAAALGHEVSPTNLLRVLSRRGAIAPVGGTVAPSAAGGRPARLFRFTDPTVQVTDAVAVLRPPAPVS